MIKRRKIVFNDIGNVPLDLGQKDVASIPCGQMTLLFMQHNEKRYKKFTQNLIK